MEGEGEIRRQLAKPRIGDDGGRARPILLRRLEQQDDPAALRTPTAEKPRQAGQDGHVPVMPAEMCLARHGGAIGILGDLLDRQPVELGADHHGRSRLSALVDGGDPMTAQARDEPVRVGGPQHGADLLRGLRFLAGQFRHAVELAPERHQLDHVLVGQHHGLPPCRDPAGAHVARPIAVRPFRTQVMDQLLAGSTRHHASNVCSVANAHNPVRVPDRPHPHCCCPQAMSLGSLRHSFRLSVTQSHEYLRLRPRLLGPAVHRPLPRQIRRDRRHG